MLNLVGSLSTDNAKNWLGLCIKSDAAKNPQPLPILANALIALRNDPALREAFAYDELAQSAMLIGADGAPVKLTDDDVTDLQEFLQAAGLKRISRSTVYDAVQNYARDRRFHPLRDWLNSLTWDAQSRISAWTQIYLGCPNTAYCQEVGRLFLLSMIARIFEPGCKADHMIVLEGPQGHLKSMALRALSDPWFSDAMPDIAGGKDVSMHLRGKWLIEIAEMHAFSRVEATHLKSFLSRQVEIYRPPYGHLEVEEPRQCVFAGTSNKPQYLRDETGGRRFWPLQTGLISVDSLVRDRAQLFAEALQMYRDGDIWWPDQSFEQQLVQPEQQARYEFDEWTPIVADWLAGTLAPSTTVATVAKLALGIPDERLQKPVQSRISSILVNLKWKFKHTEKGNVYLRP